MTLKEQRIQFTKCLAMLILKAFEWGYGVAIDEATDHITVKDPTTDHIKGSFHEIGLACDLLLYNEDGEYLKDSKDYEDLGNYWKSLDSNCTWGGDFNRVKDGNHYSYGEK